MSPGDIIKFPVFTTTSIGRFLEERGGGGVGGERQMSPVVTLLNFQYLLQHLLADSWKRGGGGVWEEKDRCPLW